MNGLPNFVSFFGAVTNPKPSLPPAHNTTGKERSKLSFKFVTLPYEERFMTFPGITYRPHSLLVCSAIGMEGVRCKERRHEGRWCRRHKEQRIRLYKNFKSFRAAISNFPQDDLECDVTRIRTLEAPCAERLRDLLRTKRWLLRGCLDARKCFQTSFYGDDMELGNDQYGHSLQRRLNEVEVLLCAAEERLRELRLSDLGVSWILARASGDGFPEACGEYPQVRLQKAQLPPSFNKPATTVTPDPVEEALKQKKYAVIIGIWDYIATLCTPPESQLFHERLAIIYAYIARCIVSDPALFLAAETYSSVEDFLTDLDQDIYVWERLMGVLSQPDLHCVRAAIDDVLRPEDDDADNLTFLGERMYRNLSDASCLPFRAWGHWAVFFPSSCLCAVKKGFATARAISLSSKFMQLHGVLPPSEHSKSIRSKLEILNLCGIHLGPFDPVGVRHSIQKQTSPDGSPMWVETHNAVFFTGCMAIDEPASPLFITSCMRHPDLMVKVRSGGTDGVAADFPEDLWSSRTREASSRSELDNVPWVLIPPSEALLDDAQQYLSIGLPLSDGLDFLVLDSSECDFEEVLEKLVQICLKIHGVKDLHKLYERYIMSYVKEGELQVDESGSLIPIKCAPGEIWSMRMHLLDVVLPGREEEQRRFEDRFLD